LWFGKIADCNVPSVTCLFVYSGISESKRENVCAKVRVREIERERGGGRVSEKDPLFVLSFSHNQVTLPQQDQL